MIKITGCKFKIHMGHPMIPTQEKIMSLILGMEILQTQQVMEQIMIMGLIYHVRFVHI